MVWLTISLSLDTYNLIGTSCKVVILAKWRYASFNEVCLLAYANFLKFNSFSAFVIPVPSEAREGPSNTNHTSIPSLSP